MPDREILARVSELVDEEHQLRQLSASGALASTDEQARLKQLGEELDQCWDLLRQRRAANVAGRDPNTARVRPVSEVEGYLQ